MRKGKIDKVKVVMGRLIRVENTRKAKLSNANDVYLAVQVEDADGGRERCLLFTKKQIEAAEKRAARNPEDLTRKGFVVDLLD
jgi:hypothetical protein